MAAPATTPPSSTSDMFTVFNYTALVGWALVLCILLAQDYECSFLPSPNINLLNVVKILEAICVLEVYRIVIGDLPGNLVLGVVLHGIRVANLIYVLPNAACSGIAKEDNEATSTDGKDLQETLDNLALFVFYSWTITELARYPMYLLGSSASKKSSLARTARFLRLTVPLLTFPVGAFCEGYSSYLTLFKMEDTMSNSWVAKSIRSILLLAVFVINFVLGPTVAYPALLKKGVPALLGQDQGGDQKKPVKKFV